VCIQNLMYVWDPVFNRGYTVYECVTYVLMIRRKRGIYGAEAENIHRRARNKVNSGRTGTQRSASLTVWECIVIVIVITTSQPTYLHNLIFLQTDNNTHSSDVTLARQSAASSLKIRDDSFHYTSPHLSNKLPVSLHEPVLPFYAYLNPSFSSPLSPSIIPSLFHSKLKTYLFGKSFPP